MIHSQITIDAHDWHKSHVQGYLELGMYEEAREELYKLREQEADFFLYARLAIALGQKDKTTAAAITQMGLKISPDDPAAYVNRGIYLRVFETPGDAGLFLTQEALPRFGSKCPVLFVNAACCHALEGHTEIAARGLVMGLQMEPSLVPLALTDQDLCPIWDWLGARNISKLRKKLGLPATG